MFVMALFFNFGSAACWKVRSLSIARQAVWGARWPRNPSGNPQPTYWPASGSSSLVGPAAVAQVDDPRMDLPIARGPLPGGGSVNSDLLNPGTGLYAGSATITNRYPLLASLGTYRLNALTWMIDDAWQYQQMGMTDNIQPRIPILYNLDMASGMSGPYLQAVQAILDAPFLTQLKPLDQDDEYKAYMVFLSGSPSALNFYPKLTAFCSLDHTLAGQNVQTLIDQIQGKGPKSDPTHVPGVPENMTNAFLNLYIAVMQKYQKDMLPIPPDLQKNIAILNTFLQTF